MPDNTVENLLYSATKGDYKTFRAIMFEKLNKKAMDQFQIERAQTSNLYFNTEEKIDETYAGNKEEVGLTDGEAALFKLLGKQDKWELDKDKMKKTEEDPLQSSKVR